MQYNWFRQNRILYCILTCDFEFLFSSLVFDIYTFQSCNINISRLSWKRDIRINQHFQEVGTRWKRSGDNSMTWSRSTSQPVLSTYYSTKFKVLTTLRSMLLSQTREDEEDKMLGGGCHSGRESDKEWYSVSGEADQAGPGGARRECVKMLPLDWSQSLTTQGSLRSVPAQRDQREWWPPASTTVSAKVNISSAFRSVFDSQPL